MRIEVVTLFPEFVAEAVRVGVLGRAIEAGRVAVRCDHAARIRDGRASHGRRSAVRRRTGNGA